MDNNLQSYSAGGSYSGDITRKDLLDEELLAKGISLNNVVWKDFDEEPQQVDMLSFMETFNFPSLSILIKSLKASGRYAKEQINEIVMGLKDLPEYRD